MSGSLRIAFVSMHTSPADMPGSGDAGGMNVVERHQALALASMGHRVELITRRSAPDQPDVREIAPGVWLRHLPAGPPDALAKSVIDAHIPEFSAALGGLEPYDVVHSHHWMSGVAALPVASAWGVPHIQSFHSVAAHPGSPLAEGEPPESAGRVPGEQLVARTSDLVVAISAAEARTVFARCGADPERIAIVSPGVDMDMFHAIGEPGWQSPSTNPNGFLLFAARLQPLKGADLAIGAVAEVPTALRPDLVIAGDVSADFAAYEEELRRHVAGAGLSGHVHFVPPLTRIELANWMRAARLVLVPSHTETFGLIALEAAACGTPVIASATGGLREAVVHGETGQLMDSRQPEDWGTAITRLLAKPDVLERMGVVSQIHARRFAWDWAGRRLETCYREAIAESSRRLEGVRSRPSEFDRMRRVVFVHAHPDDETLAGGALIAWLTRRGVHVDVLTATRGERGEVVAGAPVRTSLDARREQELGRALGVLRVSRHAYLGAPEARAAGRAPRRYLDSGMRWVTADRAGPAADAGEESLVAADVAEAAADLAAFIGDADLVVGYDVHGGYGHPDHVAMHHITRAAAVLTGTPSAEIVSSEDDRGPTVVWYDLGDQLEVVQRALRCHATQLVVDGDVVIHSGGQRQPIATRVGLRWPHPTTPLRR